MSHRILETERSPAAQTQRAFPAGIVVSALLFLGMAGFTGGQNIVEESAAGLVLSETNLTDAGLRELIWQTRDTAVQPRDASLARVAAALERHVVQFLDGWPWKPFHHTLGISGYEACFDHPDQMFYALALALPHLSPEVAAKTRTFGEQRLRDSPPYALEGFDRRAGRDRESYDVPAGLRFSGKGRARSAFGVYALWAWCAASGNPAETSNHWPAVKERMKPLLGVSYSFDPRRRSTGQGGAQKLNGDLAGLIGLARLARTNSDTAIEQQALKLARELLELRMNLERVNPHILEKSGDASKGLHNFKLARYCDLTPEVGDALRRFSGGAATTRLRTFREERNGWFMAFGDRLIGGENYTNPLHLARALFAGAALVERLETPVLTGFLDVPWCPGDFYFIEKSAWVLQRNSAP